MVIWIGDDPSPCYFGSQKSIRRYKKMEKKTCFYETLFVVSGAISEEDAKSVQDKFTTLIAENGKLIAVNEWGKRRLAYPINKVSDGYYVLASFESAPEFPLELERLMGINDAILRSMTTRLEKAPEASVAAPEASAAEEATDAE